jgi:hypothetical protein
MRYSAACAGQEEAPCLTAFLAVGAFDDESAERNYGLHPQVQPFPRGYEELRPSGLRDDLGEEAGAVRELFEIVQDEEQLLLPQVIDQLRAIIRSRGQGKAELLGDGWYDGCRILDSGERNEAYLVEVMGTESASLRRKPRLPDSPRPGDGEEPAVG